MRLPAVIPTALAVAVATVALAQTAPSALDDIAGSADIFVPLPGGGVVRLNDLDLSQQDAQMATPLHRAAAVTADPDLIRAMLARGANPRARDAQGLTPLHYAAAAGAAPGVLAALLGGGADADARDAQGRTALHVAATAQAAGVLALAGADACATDAVGRPAFSAAMLEALRTAAPEAYPAARAAWLNCL